MLKDLTYAEFYMRESEFTHSPIENEIRFFESVKKGDIEEVNKIFIPLGSEGFGILSDNNLRNLKYHLIITIAFVTRFCVEGGMEQETAYNLSDLYIRQTDKAVSKNEINAIHIEMIHDFTARMNRINKENVYSKQIVQCCEHIYNNLCRRIKITDIANKLNITTPYLSKIFHKETGMTLTSYILKKKIETACQMLRYTEYKAIDIGNYLAFNSHSHFIKSFKGETGLTPKQYRDKYYHASEGIKVGVTL